MPISVIVSGVLPGEPSTDVARNRWTVNAYAAPSPPVLENERRRECHSPPKHEHVAAGPPLPRSSPLTFAVQGRVRVRLNTARSPRSLPAAARARRQRARRWLAIPLLLETAIASTTVFVRIARLPLTHEDVASVSVATRDARSILATPRQTDADTGFYYALMHPWVAAGTGEEPWSRFRCPLFWDAAWLVRSAARLPVSSQSPIPMSAPWASRRAYGLAMLAAIIATWLFLQAMSDARRGRLIAYGAACAATIYLSPLGALVLIAHALALPARRPGVCPLHGASRRFSAPWPAHWSRWAGSCTARGPIRSTGYRNRESGVWA